MFGATTNDRNDSVGGDHADPVVERIGNEEGSLRVSSDAKRIVKLGGEALSDGSARFFRRASEGGDDRGKIWVGRNLDVCNVPQSCRGLQKDSG